MFAAHRRFLVILLVIAIPIGCFVSVVWFPPYRRLTEEYMAARRLVGPYAVESWEPVLFSNDGTTAVVEVKCVLKPTKGRGDQVPSSFRVYIVRHGLFWMLSEPPDHR